VIKVMICYFVSGTQKITTPRSFVVCSGLTGTDMHSFGYLHVFCGVCLSNDIHIFFVFTNVAMHQYS
jgi:hypothetical protein